MWVFLFLTDIEFRLGANRMICAAAAVNLSNWPSHEDERILYEDDKLLTIHQTLTMSPTLKEFQEFKCHKRICSLPSPHFHEGTYLLYFCK